MKIKLLNIFSALLMIAVLLGGALYVREKQEKVDTEPPKIKIEQDTITCSINADNKEMTAGVTASDNVDGDLSDKIMISGIQIKEEQEKRDDALKQFEITYVVFDSSNNMTTASRTLVYTDYYSPRFSLSSKLQFESVAAVRLLDYIKANDCIDGNISGQVSLQMHGEVTGFGTYTCIADVTNSLGDHAQLPFTFKVVDTTSEEEELKPSISLTDYIVYVEKGDRTFRPTDYLNELKIDRSSYKLLDSDKVEITEDTAESGFGYSNSIKGAFMLKDSISIASDVDVDTPGIYYVRYSFRHPVEDTIGSTELMVIVE